MTAVVGILCKDGVVIGSDSSATFSAGALRTIEQLTKKIHIISNKIIIAGTGQVGLGQRFCGIVQQAYDNKIFNENNHLEVGRFLSQATIQNFSTTRCPLGQYGALLAYSVDEQFFLCEFALKDFQPEWKDENIWYVSIGSGQLITDPFLGLMRRVYWKDALPNVAGATFVATWTILHAIDLNTGGINRPVQMAVLRRNDREKFEACLLDDKKLQEHINNIDEAEEYLRKYKDFFHGDTDEQIPKP